MRHKKKRGLSIEELAKDWGVDAQTVRIKGELVEVIRRYCGRNGISQRRLAAFVPGLPTMTPGLRLS